MGEVKHRQATSPHCTRGLSGVRPRPRLSATYSPRAGLLLRLSARWADTPDGRVVPEPGTVRGAFVTPGNLADSGCRASHALGSTAIDHSLRLLEKPPSRQDRLNQIPARNRRQGRQVATTTSRRPDRRLLDDDDFHIFADELPEFGQAKRLGINVSANTNHGSPRIDQRAFPHSPHCTERQHERQRAVSHTPHGVTRKCAPSSSGVSRRAQNGDGARFRITCAQDVCCSERKRPPSPTQREKA